MQSWGYRDGEDYYTTRALIRAIDCYYQYPEHFRDLIRNAMRTDYSWNLPGEDYMNIYDYIRNK